MTMYDDAGDAPAAAMLVGFVCTVALDAGRAGVFVVMTRDGGDTGGIDTGGVDIVEETPGLEGMAAVVNELFLPVHPADTITAINIRRRKMERDLRIP
jgi:hypothetical protein